MADDIDVRQLEMLTMDESVPVADARRAKKLVGHIEVRVAEILRLRATADQLAMEVSNTVANEATSLSDALLFEDMAKLLRLLSSVVR